jgi:hypothetical protein
MPLVGGYESLMRMPFSAVMEVYKNIPLIEREFAARTYSATLAAIADAFGGRSGFDERNTKHLDEVIKTEVVDSTPLKGAKGIAQLKAKFGVK